VGHFKALFCHLPAETEEDCSYLLESLKKIIRKVLTPVSVQVKEELCHEYLWGSGGIARH
jgi:hypothetical protein